MIPMQDEQSSRPMRQNRWAGYGASDAAPMNQPQVQPQAPPAQQMSAVQPQPSQQMGMAARPQRNVRSFSQY